MRYIRSHSGFTLIEALIALLVFSLGMLGIALYSGYGLKTSAANQVRATSIYAASLAMEPVLYQTRADCLSASLAGFPRKVTVDNGKDNFDISLERASDGLGIQVAGKNAITAASSTWVSPITVVLSVPYQGPDGTTYTAYPSFTVMLENYKVACNA
jgi:prepilin-type N-terminal cleavage/methylation domain-containing protein